MAFITEENQRKTNQIVQDIREYAILTDDANPNVKVSGTQFASGVGLSTEAKVLRARCNDIEQGIFKTLVMGKFKNGKSTFINALVGRIMMAARATACTAVIATVEYGNDANMVTVVNTNGSTRRMTLEQFTNEFQITEEEEETIINDNGKLDRFAEVSHVEMQSNDELFRDGVHLIDSPGLEEAVSRTKTTNEYVPKANAIIFTLSATSLFSGKEKEYIAENFAGKHMRNIFFVINRIDNLTPGQLEASVMPTVRSGLTDVFTDENGAFDEALYNKRVFFTNAYGAQCVRTGEPYKAIVGKKEVNIPIEIEDTGMPEFEAALREFLNSDERIRATFSSTLMGMANIYQSAEESINAEIAARSGTAEERKARIDEANKSLDDACAEVEDMRKMFKTAGGNIASTVYLDLVGYVKNDLPREFAASEEMKQKLGMGDMLAIAMAMAGQILPIPALREWGMRTYAARLQPFADTVNNYIRRRIEEEWPKRIPTLTHDQVEDLKDQLNDHAAEFDFKMDKALHAFSGNSATVNKENKGNFKSGLQALLALSNWDLSLATGALAEGGLNWGEFIKRVAVQLVLDGAVTIVFGAPFLIPALIIEGISMWIRKGKIANQLVSSIGAGAFETLAKEIENREMDIKNDVVNQIIAEGEKLAKTAKDKVEEQRTRMARLLAEDANDTAAAKAENDRLLANLHRMHELVEDVFKVLNGHLPSEAEYANLSRNEKAR